VSTHFTADPPAIFAAHVPAYTTTDFAAFTTANFHAILADDLSYRIAIYPTVRPTFYAANSTTINTAFIRSIKSIVPTNHTTYGATVWPAIEPAISTAITKSDIAFL
jgi:hypothetical protein